jgi:hypothetical protein
VNKNIWKGVAAATLMVAGLAHASELSGDAKASIPKDVQQIIVVDYRAMQSSTAAMNLKARIMPPELTRLEMALKSSGLKVDRDADTLAFAAFRTGSATTDYHTIGIAQGQFNTASIMASFAKSKTKVTPVRNYSVYPMGAAGMSVVFLNQTTMVFGDSAAVKAALDARDGLTPNMLTNSDMMSEMNAVDSRAVWSLLDQKGTQTMMHSVLGDAASLTDYDSVKNRMKSSRYTLDFSNGIHFDMAVIMSDSMTAATAATLMKGMVMLKQVQGSSMEKMAMKETSVESNSGTLQVSYASSDSQFSDLLSSPLFQQVVK